MKPASRSISVCITSLLLFSGRLDAQSASPPIPVADEVQSYVEMVLNNNGMPVIGDLFVGPRGYEGATIREVSGLTSGHAAGIHTHGCRMAPSFAYNTSNTFGIAYSNFNPSTNRSVLVYQGAHEPGERGVIDEIGASVQGDVALAFGDGGRPFIGYFALNQQGEMEVRLAFWNGQDWAQTVVEPGPLISHTSDISIAVNPVNGDISLAYVAWKLDLSSMVFTLAKLDKDGRLYSKMGIENGDPEGSTVPGFLSDMIFDKAGNIHLAYLNLEDDLKIKYSHGSMGTTVALTDDATNVSIGLDAFDRPLIGTVFYNPSKGRTSGGIYKRNLGGTWVLAYEEDVPSGIKDFDLAVDKADRVHLAVLDQDSHLYYRSISPVAMSSLKTDIDDKPDPVRVGGDVKYTVTISNGGPETANSVHLDLRFSSELHPVSIAPSRGICSGLWSCELGDLNAGDSMSIVVHATALKAGIAQVRAEAASLTPDRDANKGFSDEFTDIMDGCDDKGSVWEQVRLISFCSSRSIGPVTGEWGRFGRGTTLESDAGEKLELLCGDAGFASYLLLYHPPAGSSLPPDRLAERAVGMCPFDNGCNTVAFLHSGDKDGNGKPDCFVKTLWISKDYGTNDIRNAWTGEDPETPVGFDWAVSSYVVGTNSLTKRSYRFEYALPPPIAFNTCRDDFKPAVEGRLLAQTIIDPPLGPITAKFFRETNARLEKFHPGFSPMGGDGSSLCDLTGDGLCNFEDYRKLAAAVKDCNMISTYAVAIDANDDGCIDVGELNLAFPEKPLKIDVLPGRRDNKVHVKSHGMLEIAILAQPGFYDLKALKPNTIEIQRGNDSVRPKKVTYRDVNRDGFADLLLHVELKKLDIGCREASLKLTAADSANGTYIGSDSIKSVGCKYHQGRSCKKKR